MGPHISRNVLHFPGLSQYLNFQSEIGWFWASCVDYEEKKKGWHIFSHGNDSLPNKG